MLRGAMALNLTAADANPRGVRIANEQYRIERGMM